MNDAAPPALDPATLSGLEVDDPLWYKDAVIYQLNVKSFLDSNDDGIGDFQGLTSKLGYIRDLGVNTIWLMPFYPSPLRDDGYDIADYKNVHPQYGTLDDFRTFLLELFTPLGVPADELAHPDHDGREGNVGGGPGRSRGPDSGLVGRAVQLDEGTALPRAQLVQGAGDEFLAGARFASDEHRGAGGGDGLNLFEDPA